MQRCPGQDQRFWKPGDIFEVKCPICGHSVEFFKDEPLLKCNQCGNFVSNPRIDLSCAKWCKYAAQCIGEKMDNITSLDDKLIEDMKNIFGSDTRRINHALAVLDFAEQIQAQEGGDAMIIKAAAVLHDIGILEAERKYNSNSGKYQEIEGPPIARSILMKYELSDESIEHICKIIANHHTAKNIDTLEFRIIWDADILVNLHDESESFKKEKIQKIIEKRFKTKAGYKIAHELFC